MWKHCQTIPSTPEELPGPFFLLSSNIDNHPQNCGLVKDYEICEVHGKIERWQCSEPCCEETWQVPKAFRFNVFLLYFAKPKL